jgi:hypothetical protein
MPSGMHKNIIDNVDINSIIPYERNARKNDKAFKEVAKSIQRTGGQVIRNGVSIKWSKSDGK